MSRTPTLTVRNFFADLPTLISGEFFEELAACRGVRIERILSSDQPEPVLYDQAQDEGATRIRAT